MSFDFTFFPPRIKSDTGEKKKRHTANKINEAHWMLAEMHVALLQSQPKHLQHKGVQTQTVLQHLSVFQILVQMGGWIYSLLLTLLLSNHVFFDKAH